MRQIRAWVGVEPPEFNGETDHMHLPVQLPASTVR